MVYFPFDQYVLTPEALSVVQQAADYAKGGNATTVAVVGHTDTSGGFAYNMRLSERRAKATADALVGRGHPVDHQDRLEGQDRPLSVADTRRRQGTAQPPLHHLDQLL